MRETLSEINALTEAGIIGQSAIGGAIGATFYIEPMATFDLDVFVLFETSSVILTLTPIYDFLKKRGHHDHGEAINIGRWPVQFLPAESPLLIEAVQQAVTVDFEGVSTRVMSAEHLMAIALQTGRKKDYLRLVEFVGSGKHDANRLDDILERHALKDAWTNFKKKYVE